MAAGHPRSEAHLEQRAEERAAESAAVAAQTVGRQRTASLWETACVHESYLGIILVNP